MSTQQVSVIVSKCVGERIYGDRLIDATYPTLDTARKLGETYRGNGKSVIVRPLYNESDDDGRFFREWRSFDGGEFKECRWQF